MEPPLGLVLLVLCFGGALAGPPQLSQLSPTHTVDETIPRLRCQMSGGDITSHVLSWYHQPPGQGPVFLLSHRAGERKPSYGPGISERFIAHLERDTNTFSLTIGNVNAADAGTYYCAVWYAGHYRFGEGTRLLLPGDAEPKRRPEVAVLGPVPAARPAFLCLAWGFFPPLVRLRWQVGGREPGPGEVALLADGQREPGAAGLLVLPAEAWLAGAHVTCRVEHESQAQEGSQEIKGAGRPGCSRPTGDLVLPLDGALGDGTAETSAPRRAGAPSLGRILQTAWHCYLGSLAASSLYSLGVSLLLVRRGPWRPGPAPPPQEPLQRAERRRRLA